MKVSGLKKIQIAGVIIGVTLVVGLLIKFVLPLFAPFLFAFLIALAIDKPVDFLVRMLRWKRMVCTIIMLFLVFTGLGVLVFVAGRILIQQLQRFAGHYEEYISKITEVARNYCEKLDDMLSLKDGQSFDVVQKYTESGADAVASTIVPTIMNNSINVASALVGFFTVMALVIMGAMFFSKDMQKIRVSIKESVFCKEITFISERMKEILGTYFKTQGIIMGITCVICTVGLYFMGNEYAFLLGVLIGIVDAFPVFGTGTVFIPWVVIQLFMRDYKGAIGIFAIYTVCYYTRQFLEPKLMGNSLGVSPIMMLISLYLGLVLFGISGVITGPIAAMLIKEICGRIIKNL